MTRILLMLSIIIFSACGLVTKQNGGKNTVDTEVLNQIKSHYDAKYGKGTRNEETDSDTTLNIVYYNIPNDTNDYDGHLLGIHIPKQTKINLFGANPVLYGDLNNDKIDDIVISVHTEGSGVGANEWSQDLFVFQKNNGIYEITSITTDNEISGCENGMFRAKEINNGFLIGNSSCYKEQDSRLSPSLEYVTKIELINNKLKHSSKTLLPKGQE